MEQNRPRGPSGKPVTPIINFNVLLANFVYTIEQAEKTYHPDEPEKHPPARYFSKCKSLEETQAHMEKACKKANEDARDEAARQWVKQLETDLGRIKSRFQDYLFVEEKDKWPKVWMVKDKGNKKKGQPPIMERLDKTRFFDVINWLWKTATWKETQELSKFLPLKSWERLSGVLLAPDADLMASELNISLKLAQKYVQAFAKVGILWEAGKTDGRDWRKIYAIGQWVKYKDGFRRQSILIDTLEWREKLRSFNVQP